MVSNFDISHGEDRNVMRVDCNLLSSKYASGITSSNLMHTEYPNKTNLYWQKPSLPANICSLRQSSSSTTSSNSTSSSSGSSSSSAKCTFTVKNVSFGGEIKVIKGGSRNNTIGISGGKSKTFDCDTEIFYSNNNNDRLGKIGGGSSSCKGKTYTVGK